MWVGHELTVAETAAALGTSPQTVRSLLRKGEIDGEQRPRGSRHVWVVSGPAVEQFLAEYGRLDGRRRSQVPRPELEAEPDAEPPSSPALQEESEPANDRPFALRVRGRATMVVVVLGVPLLIARAATRTLPDALWFAELDQVDVYTRTLAAKAELGIIVTTVVAVVVAINLAVAFRRTEVVETPAGRLGLAAVALISGILFASAAQTHVLDYLLWRHRQPFGVADPIHGKDIGFFVFTLPFEHIVTNLLLWLVGVTAVGVALVYRARGEISIRPPRAAPGVQIHLAALAAVLLLIVAWRLRLEQYRLELGQTSAHNEHSFAGAGYVDVNVRSPGLSALTVLMVVLAVACAVAPVVARGGHPRRAALLLGAPAAMVVLTIPAVLAAFPAAIQRYVVDPNPLLSEQPYLTRSIEATRSGLALDAVDVGPYTPSGRFRAADYPDLKNRMANVSIWDTWVLDARMRQLVTDTPYFKPDDPSLDVTRMQGRRTPSVVSARELDLEPIGEQAESWINDRLAYTHGLGVVRFSTTDITKTRAPHALDDGLGVRQPRLYYGNLDSDPWVLVNTRRPEVDVPGAEISDYHYDGTGGIPMMSWPRRALFALTLGQKELLLSDDITPDSRILLHRDVGDRLHSLAPFIQWDRTPVPLTVDGRVVFVVDGYTTSQNYPYAERVMLGDSAVNYARASVRATVDAFSGRVHVYLTDATDPLARAWADAFPSLFQPEHEMPAALRSRVRYPADLFETQAAAYERFHVTDPAVFVSDADAWSRPVALSGSLEVASGVDFDESDEDDLRLTLQPAYSFAAPPGQSRPRLVLNTVYAPRTAQNLVGALSGWVDRQGRPRLAARALARDPVTLGPAQVSRIVFATPRVRNLLGLRNLEIRDLDKSSLDSVLLGRPRLLFLPGGVAQVQSLYEGSRGPGAARLLGVTVYLNGRAGLGPDIDSAVRQALNAPPTLDVRRPQGPVAVRRPVRIGFDVANARREIVTISSGDRRVVFHRHVHNGRGTAVWMPRDAGTARVRVEVVGLDGTRIAGAKALRVLSAPPTVRLVHPPRGAVVGRTVRVRFRVTHAQSGSARVSTRAGVVFARSYLFRDGDGVIEWTPRQTGRAVLILHVRGRQGQSDVASAQLTVVPRPVAPEPPVAPVPSVQIERTPQKVTIGRPATTVLTASNCRTAEATITGPDDAARTWRFRCPVGRVAFEWTPQAPGRYVLTVSARGPDGRIASQTVRLPDVPEQDASR